MSFNDIRLGSVNWEHGMLLTPEHFLRQERYFDSRLLWLLRYSVTCYGLIGGGPRLEENERGVKGDDPVFSVSDDAEKLSITVAQCRGITPGGCLVDIDTKHQVPFEISKHELAGFDDTRVFVVCTPHAKKPANGEVDGLNQQQEQERVFDYRVKLRVEPGEVPYALAIGRIVRAPDGIDFGKDPHFIPACAFVDAHSELAASAREIQDDIIALASRFTELHRAMQQFIGMFKDRGIETENDLDTMGFASRMVVALQNCVFEIMDTTQTPQTFFGNLRRFFHNAAVYLDLSIPVRKYFELLKGTGETEFITPFAQQKKKLAGSSPKWKIHKDLSDEVASAQQSIEALQKLERALEGKYIDFRVNPLLEAMNFIFDGDVLYKLHEKSIRFQGPQDRRMIAFPKLQLEGREKYRLVLVGEDGAKFDPEIWVEININETSAMRGTPRNVKCVTKPGQCNFDFDFEAPDAPTVSDLRVNLNADHPIKIGMLFVRQRFYADQREEKARALPRNDDKQRPEPPRTEQPRPRTGPATERVDSRYFRNPDAEQMTPEDLRSAREREVPPRPTREPERRPARDYGADALGPDSTQDGTRDNDWGRNAPELPRPKRNRFQD